LLAKFLRSRPRNIGGSPGHSLIIATGESV
jgi:hypothetical protein